MKTGNGFLSTKKTSNTTSPGMNMGMDEFDVLMGDMIYHKHNNSTNRWVMATMKTCETSMLGLKRLAWMFHTFRWET
jgi:hypothetical protein